jgi:transcriptional regulator with AAA-type ATPase domain
MNADESLKDMVAKQAALDRLIELYSSAEELTKAKDVETLGETGPEGEALASQIADTEAALEALGGADAPA